MRCHKGGGSGAGGAAGTAAGSGGGSQNKGPCQGPGCSRQACRQGAAYCTEACYLAHCEQLGTEPARCPRADCCNEGGPGLMPPGFVFGTRSCRACFNQGKQKRASDKKAAEAAAAQVAEAAAAAAAVAAGGGLPAGGSGSGNAGGKKTRKSPAPENVKVSGRHALQLDAPSMH